MTDRNTLEYIHPQLRDLAIPIDQLNEDPNNANEHGDRSHASIAESFKRFGQRKPIVVRREGMIVEAGNGTLAALRADGWTHLACVVCDDDEQTAIAFGLADNQSARLSKWDFDALRKNVETLLEQDYDVLGLGWSGDELAAVLAGKAQAFADDLVPTPQESPPIQDGFEDERKTNTDWTVQVLVGEYRVKVTQDEYTTWFTDVSARVGLSQDAVRAEIRRRLGI